jgi:hypothetical protein
MISNVRAVIILGITLIIAVFFYSGIYEFRSAETAPAFVVYRINRFTGRVSFCNGLPSDAIPHGCAKLPEISN